MSPTTRTPPVEILIVDDDACFARLMVESLKECDLKHTTCVLRDGREVMRHIEEQGAPHLILLDLNMSGASGFDLLDAIKTDPATRKIPVIIMSSSDFPADIERCYDLNANCYVRKPVKLSGFFDLVRDIESFWFHTAKLPGTGDAR